MPNSYDLRPSFTNVAGRNITQEAPEIPYDAEGVLTIGAGADAFYYEDHREGRSYRIDATENLDIALYSNGDEYNYDGHFSDRLEEGIRSDYGLRGRFISWDIYEHPELNGETDILYDLEQNANFVPYVELTKKNGKYTGITWRLRDSGVMNIGAFIVIDIGTATPYYGENGSVEIRGGGFTVSSEYINAGEEWSGSYTFENPISFRELNGVFIHFDDFRNVTARERGGKINSGWNFINDDSWYNRKVQGLYTRVHYNANVDIIDNVINFDTLNDGSFLNIALLDRYPEPDSKDIHMDDDHASITPDEVVGTLTIKAGEGSYRYRTDNEIIEVSNEDKTFPLYYNRTYNFYHVNFEFTPDSLEGLNGRTLEWTTRKYGTESEVLNLIANDLIVYVEPANVDYDGNFDSFTWRLAKKDNPSVAVAPGFEAFIHVGINGWNEDNNEEGSIGNEDNNFRADEIAEGTVTLDRSLSSNDKFSIYTNINHDVEYNSRFLYQWNSDKPDAPTINDDIPYDIDPGYPYEYWFYANSQRPVTWELVGGKLPQGITFHDEGVLRGIPLEAGDFEFTIRASNVAGYNEKTFTLHVREAEPPHLYTTFRQMTGIVGQNYTTYIRSWGNPPFKWNCEIEADEKGEPSAVKVTSDDKGTMIISIASPDEGYYRVKVSVTNIAGEDNGEYTISIYPANVIPERPVITTNYNLGTWPAGITYEKQLNATGSKIITWRLDSNEYPIPNGLTLTSNGSLNWTPTMEDLGEHDLHVIAENSAGEFHATLTITITEVPTLEITTDDLPEGKIGEDYSYTLKATMPGSDRELNLKWFINEDIEDYDSLPEGLELDEDTGEIRGIPENGGGYYLKIYVVDEEDDTISAERDFYLHIHGPEPEILSEYLPNAIEGVYYTYDIAHRGSGTWSWGTLSEDENVPDGLNIDSSTGRISGTPTKAGEYNVYVHLGNDEYETSRDYHITVEKAGLAINETNFPDVRFRAYVSEYVDDNSDSMLSNQEIARTHDIDVTGLGIKTLQGIEYFYALENLSCALNELTELNLESNTELVGLWCDNNQIRELDLTHNLKLESLECDNNGLEKLDVSANINLRELYCNSNNLTNLNVRNNTNLEILVCNSNSLQSLDLSNNTSLAELSCGSNQLAALDLSYNVNLDPERVHIDGQDVPGLRSYKVDDDIYEIRLGDYGIVSFDNVYISNNDINLDYDTGVAELSWLESNLYYEYNTGFEDFIVPVRIYSVAAPTIATAYLPEAEEYEEYHAGLEATGWEQISWDITNNNLPTGLELDNINGHIYGEPTESGSFDIVIEASNSYGSDTVTLTLAVNFVPRAPEITTLYLQEGQVDEEYSFTLEAEGTQPISWDLFGGKLPSGLTLDIDGRIHGTPTEAGTFTFDVTASNYVGEVSRTLSITIYGIKPAITTTHLDDGALHENYNATLSASGTPEIYWSISDGDLPDGITLSNSGILSGIPTEAGTFTFKLMAENISGSEEREFTIRIYENVTKPEIITTKISSGTLGSAYNAIVQLRTATVAKWSVSPALPSGLTLNDGTITGTPLEVCKNKKFTITASNSAGASSKTYKLTITAIVPKINGPKSLPGGVEGNAYHCDIQVTGSPVLTITASGLPAGLIIQDNAIQGTPTVGGKFNVTIMASNAGGKATKKYKLEITPIPAIAEQTLANATVGKSYKAKLKLNVSNKASWSISEGTLPPGLKLSNGTISGKSTATGTFTFTVRAVVNNVSAYREFTVVVKPTAPKIKTSSLPKGSVDAAYNATLVATGGGTLTWNVSGLPSGMEFDEGTGKISGTPTVGFNGKISVRVSNEGGSASKNIKLVIKAVKPAITTTSLPRGYVGSEYKAHVSVTGTPAFTYTLANPKGFSFRIDTDGNITGTPSKKGTYSFTITVKNSAGSAKRKIKIEFVEDTPSTNRTLPEVEEYYHEDINVPENSTTPEDFNNGEESATPEAQEEQVQVLNNNSTSPVFNTDDYVVIAEFDEVTVEESGQYEFEVDLDETAPVGAKLYWFASPIDAEPSDDDEIADFIDENGEYINSVPESRLIIVSPWLTEGVTYKPVIAVKKSDIVK